MFLSVHQAFITKWNTYSINTRFYCTVRSKGHRQSKSLNVCIYFPKNTNDIRNVYQYKEQYEVDESISSYISFFLELENTLTKKQLQVSYTLEIKLYLRIEIVYICFFFFF